MFIPILIFSLPLLGASEESFEYLEETSDCVKDLPPSQSSNFHLYPATYERLIKYNDFFIDKTLLLKEIFRKNSSYLTMFYLPRKFGKSTNLQMIRTFAEINLDSSFLKLPREDTFAYNFFTRGKIIHENGIVELLKKPPLISSYSDIIDRHLGQYPVVYLNFSSLQDADYLRTWNCMKDRIGSEFLRYSFAASRIQSNDLERFKKLVEYFERTEGAYDREYLFQLPNSVEILGKIVGEFFKKKPILIIDEYDSCVDSFLHENYIAKTEDEKVIRFFALFSRIFSKIGIWERVILTGTYSVFKSSLDFLRESKTIYDSLHNDLGYFFGFTETDVKLLSGHFRLSEDELEQAREYYKGYRMGAHYPIYNPWSILKYFQTKRLENHWEQTFRNKNFLNSLFMIDKMRNVWIGFLGDRTRCATHIFAWYSESDLWIVKNILATKVRTNAISRRKFTQILMYLADIGQLTWMRYREPDPTKTFTIWLPNEDIRISTFLRLRAVYMKLLDVKISLADEAASKLHSYLSSDRPGQLFLDVMRSFEQLYNQSSPLFEIDPRHSVPKPKQVARHIVDYIGLRLRYQYDYRIDPMFMCGFLLRKSNVTHVVIFNYNQSVESGQILERLKNYTHPWMVLRWETKMVKYVVMSISNDSDPHMLSYTNKLPDDYSPPVLIGGNFTTVSLIAGGQTNSTEERLSCTEMSISTYAINDTETSSVVLTDLESTRGLVVFDNETTILETSTNSVETIT